MMTAEQILDLIEDTILDYRRQALQAEQFSRDEAKAGAAERALTLIADEIKRRRDQIREGESAP